MWVKIFPSFIFFFWLFTHFTVLKGEHQNRRWSNASWSVSVSMDNCYMILVAVHTFISKYRCSFFDLCPLFSRSFLIGQLFVEALPLGCLDVYKKGFTKTSKDGTQHLQVRVCTFYDNFTKDVQNQSVTFCHLETTSTKLRGRGNR